MSQLPMSHNKIRAILSISTVFLKNQFYTDSYRYSSIIYYHNVKFKCMVSQISFIITISLYLRWFIVYFLKQKTGSSSPGFLHQRFPLILSRQFSPWYSNICFWIFSRYLSRAGSWFGFCANQMLDLPNPKAIPLFLLGTCHSVFLDLSEIGSSTQSSTFAIAL